MSGRSGGSRRGKESKAHSSAASANSSGKMGAQTQPNLQKHGSTAASRDPAAAGDSGGKHGVEFSSKLQPTAEQIRLATLIQDSSKSSQSDEETNAKIKELMDLTKCDGDKAALVLHDCDYDLSKAVDVILEGGAPGEQEWTELISRKKKKQQNQPAKGTGLEDSSHDDNQNWDTTPPMAGGQEGEKGKGRRGGKGGAGGGANGGGGQARRQGAGAGAGAGPEDNRTRSNRGPPRLRRGRGGGNVPREGDSKGGFSGSGGRDDNMAGDGEGRGRRMANGPGGGSGRGRARGAGRGPRTFRNQQQSPDVDGFPQAIDTWTNSQAEGYSDSTKTRDLKVGKWDDSFPNADDWDNEEWTGSLADTRVFTPSTSTTGAVTTTAPTVGKPGELPKPIGPSNGESKMVPLPPPLSPNVPKSMGGAPPGLSYSPGNRAPTMHQTSGTIDLATLLGTKQSSSAVPSAPTELDNQRLLSQLKPVVRGANETGQGISPPPGGESLNLFPHMTGDFKNQPVTSVPSAMPQRRGLKPRSSKIPSSAVEMPQDPIAVLDVQFGGLSFSDISNPPVSDPSILSYTVATSSAPGSGMGFGPTVTPTSSAKDMNASGADRKPATSPAYYARPPHTTPPPTAPPVSTSQHPPPSSSAGSMESSQSGAGGDMSSGQPSVSMPSLQQSAVNGPYSVPQTTQGYQGAQQSSVYGANKSSVSVSTGTESAVTGGNIYVGSYPATNGSVGSVATKMTPTKDTSASAAASYRQVAPAPAKGKVNPMQMSGYPPVTAGAAGMAPILASNQQYFVTHAQHVPGVPPQAGPGQYYPPVFPVNPVEDMSVLTHRMPPMAHAHSQTAAGYYEQLGPQFQPHATGTVTAATVTSAANRQDVSGGLGHYSTSSVSDKFGQVTTGGQGAAVSTTVTSGGVGGSGGPPQGVIRGDPSSPGPQAQQQQQQPGAAPSIPVSQPAHAAQFMQLFLPFQHYVQPTVSTTFPGAASQIPYFPVPQGTNNVHGHGSSNSSQYQKQNAFVQHPYSAGYEHMGNSEYGKSYMANSKAPTSSGIGGPAPGMQGGDVATMYANKKVSAYEKFGPTNPPMAATATPSQHYQQYPMVIHQGMPTGAPNAGAGGHQAQQHASPILPVHPQQSYMQDGSGANTRNAAGISQQNKVPSKGYSNWY